jgi:DNA-binding MarR family transcriptional regulator
VRSAAPEELDATDREALADLDAPRARLVYCYLLGVGCTSADEAARDLDVRPVDLYAALETLVDRGLVDRVADGYVAL